MKYLVFRVLTGADISDVENDGLYVFTHMSFHNHLCHIDVAEANKAMVATAFGSTPNNVEVVGAGFVEFMSMGDVRCYGYSDSLNIHSRGVLDSEVIRASMLQMLSQNPNKLEDLFGEFEQVRSVNNLKLNSLRAAEFILTKRAGVVDQSHSSEVDSRAHIVRAFTIVKFRNVIAHEGQTYFVFDCDGEDFLFRYGVLSTLIALNETTAVLQRADDETMPTMYKGVTFTCVVSEYGIPVGAHCAVKSIVFEEDHDPALAFVSVGTVVITVNGEDNTIEMKLIDLCDMVKNGQEHLA